MRLVSAILLSIAVALAPLGAQASSPWAGTWRLDIEKSIWNPGPAPYVRGTWRVEPSGDGLKMIYDLVGTRGGVTHMEWTGRFDGADYALQGPDAPVTYAYTQTGERTLSLVVKVDGNIAALAKIVLAPDGRTLTTETTVNNPRLGQQTTTTIYEKR